MIHDENIIVTGGAGSIGSQLVRQLVANNRLYIIDNDETNCFGLIEELRLKGCHIEGAVGDITNPAVFADVPFIPNRIFHAAARKHVTPMEKTPREAVNTNIIGTLNVIEYAKKTTARVIFISTDKAVQATSVMGATKRVSELITKNAGHTVVRFGNVLGSRGSVIPLWQASLDRGEPLNVTHEEATRYMMTIEEACALVIYAAEHSEPGELWIMDMGEKINVLQLAKKIISESKKDVGINIIGLRPGEQLTERIMFDEEMLKAVKQNQFYVIK